MMPFRPAIAFTASYPWRIETRRDATADSGTTIAPTSTTQVYARS